jgi:nicotinate-nucleotide adenylyltransferase
MTGNIGLFGGSFDPVHIQHLIIANTVLNEFVLEKVIFIPNYVSPFKNKQNTTDITCRMEMLKISLCDNPKFELSNIEAEKKRPVYTYETVEHFRKELPGKNLHLIIGYDSFVNIRSWKNYNSILENVRLIVAPRPGIKGVLSSDLPDCLMSKLCPEMNISSSMIRKMAGNNLDIKYLVNEEVRHYIRDKKLYTAG